jgi:hypothetical protein
LATVSDYNREQLEAIHLVRNHLKTLAPSDLGRLKRKISLYLQFRHDIEQFLEHHFADICTRKCYQDNYSACCNCEGITTFFADVVINALESSPAQTDRLMQALSRPVPHLKCVYLGQQGCLWQVKPIVCEMFLCGPAREAVFDPAPHVLKEWRRFRKREKRYTWPDRPVLFDVLEADFIRAGHSSSLMYFHNSPGLLRVKQVAERKRENSLEET